MKTKQQVEREFREALQRLVDEYSAELEAMDHWEGYPECGQDVRMTAYIPAIYAEDRSCIQEFCAIDLGPVVSSELRCSKKAD